MKVNRSPENTAKPFPVRWVRTSFPALNEDENFVFFDNAAGAQVPQGVLDAVNKHLLVNNVQRGGRYSKSQEVEDLWTEILPNDMLLLTLISQSRPW